MNPPYDPIHPGEILGKEFLEPLGVSAAHLARAIHVPTNRVTRLMRGQASVTPDTALRLARALRTSPEFWLNLQLRFDLDTAQDAAANMVEITPIVAA
ncbi:MAG: HigA family addiction module antitoxin [Maricaulaceae bacterium]